MDWCVIGQGRTVIHELVQLKPSFTRSAGVDGVEHGCFAGRVEAEANSDGGGDTE